MTFIGKHCSILCLLVISRMIGSTQVQAQSREVARKRLFAELLARRTQTLRAESGGAIAASPRIASRPVQTTSLARSPKRFRPSHFRHPRSSPRFPHFPPVLLEFPRRLRSPPAGLRSGRDSFIESLYPQILGDNAAQSESDYWSGVLARGVSAEAVARSIWDSREHRTLVRMHEAPGIPFGTAYRTAGQRPQPTVTIRYHIPQRLEQMGRRLQSRLATATKAQEGVLMNDRLSELTLLLLVCLAPWRSGSAEARRSSDCTRESPS